jgi:hypothetical protein
MTAQRIRLVIFQAGPSNWIVHGLEHDIVAEGGTIGSALRAAVRFIDAQTAFDVRHSHLPLSVFAPAAQRFWNAFAAGTPVPLAQLGVASPEGWEVQAAFATKLPSDTLPRRSMMEAQTLM